MADPVGGGWVEGAGTATDLGILIETAREVWGFDDGLVDRGTSFQHADKSSPRGCADTDEKEKNLLDSN